MDNKLMIKQIVDFNQSAFDNTFNAMVIWQDQAERGWHALREQAAWAPGEGQALVDEWADACKKGRSELKETVTQSFKKAYDFIDA